MHLNASESIKSHIKNAKYDAATRYDDSGHAHQASLTSPLKTSYAWPKKHPNEGKI